MAGFELRVGQNAWKGFFGFRAWGGLVTGGGPKDLGDARGGGGDDGDGDGMAETPCAAGGLQQPASQSPGRRMTPAVARPPANLSAAQSQGWQKGERLTHGDPPGGLQAQSLEGSKTL